MEPLRVVLDATETDMGLGEFDPRDPEKQGRITAVGGMPAGTDSGRASLFVLVELPDGRQVLGETTLALLAGATRALTARYPDDRP